MSKTLTITLSDTLEQALRQTAAQANQSTEELIVQLLSKTLMTAGEEDSDPLVDLFGSIQSDVPDLADHHDAYIGQSMNEELYRNE